MWEDFESIFSVFPQLRWLSLSLYNYRENPRWASIKPLKVLLNNLILKFSSEMITPDDNIRFSYLWLIHVYVELSWIHRYRAINVGYLSSRFDYFLSRFAPKLVPTKPTMVPSRTRRALSIPRVAFYVDPPP
jgi:hypothetical protein